MGVFGAGESGGGVVGAGCGGGGGLGCYGLGGDAGGLGEEAGVVAFGDAKEAATADHGGWGVDGAEYVYLTFTKSWRYLCA